MGITSTRPNAVVAAEVQCSFREFLLYFLLLGTFGFGGPIALAGYMQRDLVEDRHWVSKEDYLEGLAFSQLSPGPLAAQLAMYLGWLRRGRLGATLVGIAFILPSFLMVLVLAGLYVHFGQLHWIQGMFYGIGAAVIAIIARSDCINPSGLVTSPVISTASRLWVELLCMVTTQVVPVLEIGCARDPTCIYCCDSRGELFRT